MYNTSVIIKKMNDYKKCMRLLNCTNYAFTDEINCFKLKKISKYTKLKLTYKKVKLVYETLINKKDLVEEDIKESTKVLYCQINKSCKR